MQYTARESDMKKMDDTFCMQKALELAAAAFEQGEFPVGCVISDGHSIIVQGARLGTAEHGFNEIDHAEIVALRRLPDKMPELNSDVSKFTLYSTLEPCLMCMGAILISGIGRIVYAYEDAMGGGTQISRHHLSPLYRNRKIRIVPYLLRRESLTLLKRFFQKPDNHYWADSLLAAYTLDQTA